MYLLYMLFDHVFYSMFYNDVKGSKHMILYHYKNIGKNRFQNYNELCNSSFDIEYSAEIGGVGDFSA